MRILQVVHGWPPESIGGTEIYVRWLARALVRHAGDQVTVIAREADPNRPEQAVTVARETDVQVFRVNNTFLGCVSFEDGYRQPAMLAAIEDVVDRVRPDVVHVHHLTCLSTDLVAALKARGLPVIMTLHDYWLICHRGQLFDLDERRCEGGVRHACGRCIPPQLARPPLGLPVLRAAAGMPLARATWRAMSAVAGRLTGPGTAQSLFKARRRHMMEAAAGVDVFLAPSAAVADRIVAWGVPAARVRRHDLGIGSTASVRQTGPGSPLRLGFIGSFLPSKAPHLLVEAASALPFGTVTVDLIGASVPYHGDSGYLARLVPLLERPVVRAAGPVDPDEMRGRLAALDVVVTPSVWLENAPLVIREAFAAGLPVVASRLGGMAEAVRDGVDGLLFSPGDVADLARVLRRLVDEPNLWPRLAANVRAPRSIDDDAAATRALYASLARRRPERP